MIVPIINSAQPGWLSWRWHRKMGVRTLNRTEHGRETMLHGSPRAAPISSPGSRSRRPGIQICPQGREDPLAGTQEHVGEQDSIQRMLRLSIMSEDLRSQLILRKQSAAGCPLSPSGARYAAA